MPSESEIKLIEIAVWYHITTIQTFEHVVSKVKDEVGIPLTCNFNLADK